MKKLVSVNILTHNGEKLINPCLDSVLKQTYPDIDILIIDNASKDNTLKNIHNINIIKNKKNLGFAKAHNIGIKKSKGDYILCLNQDVVLDKDFVKNTVKRLEKNKKAAAVQAKIYKVKKQGSINKEQIDTTGLIILKNRRAISRGQGEKDKGQYKAGEVFGADGAAPLYSRKALEDVKINNEYFDEDFFCYKEDVDLAWRFQLYNWKTFYEPKAIAYHLRGAGDSAVRKPREIIKQRKKISELAKYYSFKNQRLMQIKNELLGLFFSDIFYILIKEISAWIYVLVFETYTLKVVKDLIKEIPSAWEKRKIIMLNKKIKSKQLKKWFQ